jgi:hypothetical protein
MNCNISRILRSFAHLILRTSSAFASGPSSLAAGEHCRQSLSCASGVVTSISESFIAITSTVGAISFSSMMACVIDAHLELRDRSSFSLG